VARASYLSDEGGGAAEPKLRVRTFVTPPLATNTYLLFAGGEALVIDPGAGGLSEIVALARDLKLTIRSIVNTHGHWDHTAGNAALIRLTGATLLVHEADAEMVRSPSRFLPAPFEVEGAEPAFLLSEGTEIELGGLKLRVRHTPGHTPGGICLVAGGARAVFSGDTLFAGSYGRVDLPGGDEDALLSSLRALAEMPEDFSVYPGHGPATTIRAEKGWIDRL